MLSQLRNVILFLFLFILAACYGPGDPGIDYASISMKEEWMHHPVLGDPSFDRFIRYENNPLQRGAPPLEWPVNGFLFEDPVTGNEYIYAGQYPKNYAIAAKDQPLDITRGCVVYCSQDHGKSWQTKGPVFQDKNFVPEGESKPITFAPDVSVVSHEGKYYAGFDYVTSEFSWSGNNLKHSGLAVAEADSPEGPFRIFKKPAVSCSYLFDNPVFGKYNRCYAGTLLKTGSQWIMLFMLDSGPNFSWALAAVSAPSPEGPWSAPVLIKSVEDEGYYPSLMEFFPAFQHNDTIYAPATSVALNRNFQTMLAVPSSEVMQPGKWKLAREGSLWHSENRENEYAGIWGQTFSGFVNKEGQFKVIFPSLDPQKRGTINLASTDWNNYYRNSGFVLTGQNGASVSTVPDFYLHPEIKASFSWYGTIAVLLNARPPSGPNTPKADATLHPLMFSDQSRVQFSENRWFLIHSDSDGVTDTISSGSFDKRETTDLNISYVREETIISIDGITAWKGKIDNLQPGRVGLLAMPHSGMEMKHFIVSGKKLPGHTAWLYTEGLLNAGNNLNNWNLSKDDSLFRFRIGAVAKIDSARVKWSFKGSGFDLWAPGLKEAGRVQIILNGKNLAEINLQSETPKKSKIIYSLRNLPKKNNALSIKGLNGKIVVDCLMVYD
jgi:hypothetical protein